MVRNKNIDDLNIEPETESNTESVNKIRKPMQYKDMDDAEYIKCKHREDFVALAQGDKHSAVDFLRRNEQYFRMNYTQEEKEILHRFLTWDTYMGLTVEDEHFVRDLFGPKQPCRMTPSNTQYSESKNNYREPNTPLGWIRELHESTFARFRKWMNNPSNKLSLDKLDDNGRDELCELFEYQIRRNYVIPYQDAEGLGYNEKDNVWINQI